jgi:hypothetical protein
MQPDIGQDEDARSVLDRLGIAVPAGDLPFLQRTFVRQRELLDLLAQRVPPETEPASAFGAKD